MQRKGNPEHAEQLEDGYISAIRKMNDPGQGRELIDSSEAVEEARPRPIYETA